MNSPFPSTHLQRFIPSTKPHLYHRFMTHLPASYSDPEERLPALLSSTLGEWFLPIDFDQDNAETILSSSSSSPHTDSATNPSFILFIDSSFGGSTQTIFAATESGFSLALEPSLLIATLTQGRRQNELRLSTIPERFWTLVTQFAQSHALSFIYDAPSDGILFPESGIHVSEQHSLSTTQIVVKNDDSGEDEIFTFGPLQIEDAEQVNSLWPYRTDWSINLIKFIIANKLTICARKLTPGGPEIAAWFVEYHDATVGMLHTVEQHRRKGLAAHLVQRMDEMLRKIHRRGHGFVVEENDASRGLFYNYLKCEMTRKYTWIGYKKDDGATASSSSLPNIDVKTMPSA